MVTCIVLYIILIITAILRRKRKLPVLLNEDVGKQILLILFCVNTIAFSLFWMDMRGESDGNSVRRNKYGEGQREEAYEVEVEKELEKHPVVVQIEEQRYTKEEIRDIFRKITEEMEQVILGENESLDCVQKDMNLLTEWETYPVQIQWELDQYEVMNLYGEIQEEKTVEEGTLVEIQGTLRYGEEEALYVTNAMIYPETKGKEASLLAAIEQQLKQEEESTREQESFPLPDRIEGKKIRWEKKADVRGYYILLLGFAGAGMIPLLKKQNRQKEEKKKQEQMLTDYPEIINKFTLLLSTGMTVRNVWEKIVSNYEEQKAVTGVRAAYEEMKDTYYEMQGGIAEAEAYERFGKRCHLSVYIKFAALLAQNLKKGTKGITELLRTESVQAFENRKSRAKQLGEEAGTKLLVPMFGMLSVVLVIVVVPAFLSIQL